VHTRPYWWYDCKKFYNNVNTFKNFLNRNPIPDMGFLIQSPSR
jgi:hypothetical protein